MNLGKNKILNWMMAVTLVAALVIQTAGMTDVCAAQNGTGAFGAEPVSAREMSGTEGFSASGRTAAEAPESEPRDAGSGPEKTGEDLPVMEDVAEEPGEEPREMDAKTEGSGEDRPDAEDAAKAPEGEPREPVSVPETNGEDLPAAEDVTKEPRETGSVPEVTGEESASIPETDTENADKSENDDVKDAETGKDSLPDEHLPDIPLEDIEEAAFAEEELTEEEAAFAEEKLAGEEPIFPEEGGWYRLVPKTAPNTVLGTLDGAMVNDTAIIPAQYMRLEHQIFRFDKGENGGWILTNGASEKVAALSGTEKGAELRIYARGKANSEFQVTCLKNGNITLQNADGRYVKVVSGRVVAGSKTRTDAAEFSLAYATNVPDMTFSGTFFLRTLSRIRLVAGISKSSTASGAKALLTNYSDAAAQRFSFLYSSDGYYRIVSVKSRKVLTAQTNGTIVQKSWTCANTQRWRPAAAPGGYYLVNADGNVLTVQGEYVKKGIQLTAEARNSTKNQVFLLLERGSADAKKNLVKKPVTIYQGVDYAAVYSYDDYMDRYMNLANLYGTDCAGALQYFVEHGMADGQHGSNTFDVWSYRRLNHEVRKNLLADIPAYYLHYINEGKAQGLPAVGKYQTTQAPALHDLAWRAYNEVGSFQNRPAGQEMCEYLSRAAQVEYEAYGFPKSVVIAVAIKECGFLTFNDGLPPATNNVLTMNVSLWNALWKSSWLGNYVSVRVPQYDSVLGKIVYGYEPVRCYEDIEACMDDFANFKLSYNGPLTEDMSLEEIIDKYLSGYATSPTYTDSIKAIIKLHQLTRFDEE